MSESSTESLGAKVWFLQRCECKNYEKASRLFGSQWYWRPFHSFFEFRTTAPRGSCSLSCGEVSSVSASLSSAFLLWSLQSLLPIFMELCKVSDQYHKEQSGVSQFSLLFRNWGEWPTELSQHLESTSLLIPLLSLVSLIYPHPSLVLCFTYLTQKTRVVHGLS